MSATIANLFAAALFAAVPLAHAAATSPESAGRQETETPSTEPDPFELRTADLPHSAPGRWAQFFDFLERGEMEPGVSADLLERQARAEQAYAQRDYRAALSLLFGVLTDAPDFPPGLLVLGTIEFRLRRYGEAQELFERFIRIAPAQVFRTQALAHCYYSLGDYERARDHYRIVMGGGAESLEALRGLALSLYRLGETADALASLDLLLEQEPDNVEGLIWKAQLLYEELAFQDALHLAERATRLAPWEPRPLYIRSRCLFELDREDEAEAARVLWREIDQLAQESRRLEGRLPFESNPYPVAIELTEICRRNRDLFLAREALDIAERTRPESVAVLDFRLYALDVLWEVGDRRGAAIAADLLGLSCPDEPEAWKRLEVYYAQIRDRRRQLEAGERWRKLESGG